MKISAICAPFDSSARPYDAREDRPRADPRGRAQGALFKGHVPPRLQPSASGLVSTPSDPLKRSTLSLTVLAAATIGITWFSSECSAG